MSYIISYNDTYSLDKFPFSVSYIEKNMNTNELYTCTDTCGRILYK